MTIQKYTKFVFHSKWVLWVLIISTLAVIILIPVINAKKSGIRIGFSSDGVSVDEKPMMKNPRFQGFDKNMRPYTVTADFALQNSASEIELHKVKADIILEDESWVMLSADKGYFFNDRNMLKLRNNVYIFHDDKSDSASYEFYTEQMDINIKNGTAESKSPVTLHSADGVIKADEFFAYDGGDRLVFKKNVRMTINGAAS